MRVRRHIIIENSQVSVAINVKENPGKVNFRYR